MSWISIWLIFTITLIFFYQGKECKYIGLIIIISLSILRWDIGNDYLNLFNSVNYSTFKFNERGLDGFKYTIHGFEIFKPTLEYLVHQLYYPVVWVAGIFSIITIYLWYKALNRINGLFWGFYSILFFGILFNSWDQVRQALAIAIFIYSIRYIEINNLKQYLICCLLAFLVHNSALIMLPLFFLAKIPLKSHQIICLVTFFLIGYIGKIWQYLFESLFSMIDIYSIYAVNKTNGQDFTSNTGAILKTLIYLSLIIGIYPRYKVIGNILLFGLLMYLFSCSNEMIIRIANYGTFVIMLALPLFFQENKTQIKRIIGYGIVSLIFLIGTKNAILGESGALPYESIFSEKFHKNIFRTRDYLL